MKRNLYLVNLDSDKHCLIVVGVIDIITESIKEAIEDHFDAKILGINKGTVGNADVVYLF